MALLSYTRSRRRALRRRGTFVEGTFRAVTGEIAAFTFWDIGEPSGGPSGGPTNCAHTGFEAR